MKRKKRMGLAIAIGFFVVAVFGMRSLADTVYVNASNLNYRSGASMTSEVLGTVPRGTKLEREKNLGEWSTVTVGGKTVYVASRYLSQNQVMDIPQNQNQPGTQYTQTGSGTAGKEDAEGLKYQLHAVGDYIEKSWNVSLDMASKYAENSKINSGSAVYYQAAGTNRKNKTVCVNAGHGTSGGSAVKTLSHPDGTPKVTGGTTAAGAVYSTAISSGMTFNDGTTESAVTLKMAKILREKLLKEGYDVLMIREEADVQLDNIARTVIANQNADCHIALHWDSTTTNKGAFYMSVPNIASYRAMEPVASNWEKHHKLGNSLIEGLKAHDIKIFSSGTMAMDLTQTSYSTIPSVDMELGDKASDHSDAALQKLADGLVDGVNRFFQ